MTVYQQWSAVQKKGDTSETLTFRTQKEYEAWLNGRRTADN